MAKYLLHGTLLVTIHDAQNIVNEERKSGKAPSFFRKVRFYAIILNLVVVFALETTASICITPPRSRKVPTVFGFFLDLSDYVTSSHSCSCAHLSFSW